MAAAKENDYAFFKNFKEYRESIKKLQNGTLSSLEDNKCNSFRSDPRFVQLNNSEQICKDFKSLSNSMVSFQDERAGDSTRHISACGFLNYWLNDKLRYDGNDVLNYVKNFYEKLQEDNDFDKDKLLKNNIYDINYVDLKNLRVLYNLYDNLYKITAIIGNKPVSISYTCAYYTSTCVEEYKEAKILCNDEDSIFCKALDEFRASYISVQNDPNDEKGCHLNTLGKLPTNEEILLHRSTLLGGKIYPFRTMDES
ncbi:hypothetical protein, conserved [Plasmodium vivax]|uniref:PIR Superfamily Protein n=1 Tax=Plasmodium vivax TaxID=5855 RepID=A0A1G4E792_PLAVI|nr:hypothetical protein, conserved [Plasmodium vivax]